MNRYRLEVAVSFEPPVDRLRQARFADMMRAAYDSEVIQESEVNRGRSSVAVRVCVCRSSPTARRRLCRPLVERSRV